MQLTYDPTLPLRGSAHPRCPTFDRKDALLNAHRYREAV